MSENIELKARLTDLAQARQVAQDLSTRPVEILEQTDTYFPCRHGRLKLRETVGRPAQLVAYHRPDRAEARASDYRLAEVTDAAGLSAVLEWAWGRRIVVRKRRELYFYHNVRIHLDEVAGLGAFLEFEAMLNHAGPDGQPVDATQGHRQLAWLAERFALAPATIERASYADLVESTLAAAGGDNAAADADHAPAPRRSAVGQHYPS